MNKMAYQIMWSKKAADKIEKLDEDVKSRIMKRLDVAAENPFSYVTKLKGLDFYRLRVGNYRVIMRIEGSKMIIFIINVGYRSSVYKKY